MQNLQTQRKEKKTLENFPMVENLKMKKWLSQISSSKTKNIIILAYQEVVVIYYGKSVEYIFEFAKLEQHRSKKIKRRKKANLMCVMLL